MLMAYNRHTWNAGSSGGTPITAAKLNEMEAGIEAGSNRPIGSLVNTQDGTGAWRYNAATVKTYHDVGLTVLWVTNTNMPAPTAADGLATGDVVNGTVKTA